jgi:hypothetical protein
MITNILVRTLVVMSLLGGNLSTIETLYTFLGPPVLFASFSLYISASLMWLVVSFLGVV